MRPLLHFTPEHGWMNDPNGLIERDGVHHLFFQHHPDDITFGRMHWGHASSRDLITWVEHGSALAPGGQAPGGLAPGGAAAPYDQDGVWSGCAVPTEDGVRFVYSGRGGEVTLPCLARATTGDLTVLERHPANPVIPAPPTDRTVTDFRDHVVWRDGALWRQGIGVGTVEAGGGVVTYSSPDLVEWTYDGPLLEAAGHGLPGAVWECPDLLLPPLTEPGRAVLLVSLIGAPVGGRSQPVVWIAGALHGSPDGGPRLDPDAWGLLDLGTRFYAPQSYPTGDGRRLMFGWLREQLEYVDGDQVDGDQVDGAALPRERVGIMSLPRELTVRAGRPHQAPSAEVDALRASTPSTRQRIHGSTVFELVPQLGQCVEVDVAMLPGPAGDADPAGADPAGTDLGRAGVVVTLSGGPGSASFVVDLGALVREPTWWTLDGGGWAPQTAAASGARVLFDRGVVEVFLDNGTAAAWTPVHLPEIATITVEIRSSSALAEVSLWPLTRP